MASSLKATNTVQLTFHIASWLLLLVELSCSQKLVFMVLLLLLLLMMIPFTTAAMKTAATASNTPFCSRAQASSGVQLSWERTLKPGQLAAAKAVAAAVVDGHPSPPSDSPEGGNHPSPTASLRA